MNTLERVLAKTLTAQLLLYLLTHATFFISIRSEESDFSGLAGFLWLFIFALLGVINFVLFIVYVTRAKMDKRALSKKVIGLFVISILAAVFYVKLSAWLSSLA